MTNETSETAPSEREEIEMLLPWHATGQLDTEDAARVDAYLLRHPEMLSQLDVIADEHQATLAVHEAIVPPAGLMRGDVLAEIAARPETRARRATASFWSSIQDLFTAATPATARWAIAGLCALVVCQAVVLGLMSLGSSSGTAPPSDYQLASGQNGHAPSGPALLIRIDEGARFADVRADLSRFDLVVIGGPDSAGFLTVTRSAKAPRAGSAGEDQAGLTPEQMAADLKALAKQLRQDAASVSFATVKGS